VVGRSGLAHHAHTNLSDIVSVFPAAYCGCPPYRPSFELWWSVAKNNIFEHQQHHADPTANTFIFFGRKVRQLGAFSMHVKHLIDHAADSFRPGPPVFVTLNPRIKRGPHFRQVARGPNEIDPPFKKFETAAVGLFRHKGREISVSSVYRAKSIFIVRGRKQNCRLFDRDPTAFFARHHPD
jgi:hypothetical protein